MSNFVFIVDNLGKGGMEKVTLDIATKLANRNHTVRLINLATKDTVLFVPPEIDYQEISEDDSKIECFETIFKIAYDVDPSKKDLKIIISHCPGSKLSELLRNHYYDSPLRSDNIVWHWAHGEWFRLPPFKRARYLLSGKFSKGAKRISDYFGKHGFMNGGNLIVCSNETRHSFSRFKKINSITVIENGIDIENTLQSANEFVVNQNWSACYIGRLTKDKNVPDIIKAYKKSNISGNLAIIGDGLELVHLKKCVNDLKLESKVDFLGWQKNPYPYLAKCKLLIMASQSEGLPLVLLESLSLGLSVACYDIYPGSIRTFLQNTHFANGITSKRTVKQLADKIYHVFNEPYCRDEALLKRLSLDYMAQQFEKLGNDCS